MDESTPEPQSVNHVAVAEVSTTIAIQVLFFGSAREAVGNVSSIRLALPCGSDTLTLRTMLATQYPKLSHVILDHDNITLAVNEEYIVGTQALQQGDVVALIPPISGG